MTAVEQWQQAQDLFHAALEREPRDRFVFLDEACGGNEALRKEVAELISAHETEDHFIDAPAYVAAADVWADGQELRPGQTRGHYQIRSVLGEGGMGKVYLAEDLKLKRNVALKLLPSANTGTPEGRRRLLREARAAAALDHPNICAIYEVDETRDRSYIAMQYVEGETLEARMGKARLSLDDSLNIASQVAGALAQAHAHNIIHLDIKPSNIMLASRGQVKILDFGLARTASATLIEPDEAETKEILTTPGMILGTVPYMSPEQLRGQPVDARSDIFSFGVVLYEMLSGRPAFGRTTDAETIGAILHEQPPELSSIDPNLPEPLAEVVRKCLAKDVEQRYQTVEQVVDDLNIARSGNPAAVGSRANSELSTHYPALSTDHRKAISAEVAKPRVTSSIEYLVNEVKGHRRSAILATTVLVILASVFGYYSYSARGGEAIDSLAVLPFVNVNNDPNTEYLSDGLSDSLINSLSQLPNLKKVISLNSVLPYKGKQIDPLAVGRELNVGAVLTGRVTLRGDEVLVSTELVDVKDNSRLWGRHYSHKLADVFRLRGEIAQDISEKLRLKLSGEEKEWLTRSSTENAEAYQLYLQGRYYWWKNTDEATLKSGEYFQRAIGKDPNFALAYVGLADYYMIMAGFGNMRSNEAWPQAEAAAVKALAIDERIPAAHRALGSVKMWYDWDWPGAERELKRAIELNDAEPDNHGLYNRLLEVTGRFNEAIADASVDWNQPPGSRLARETRLPKLLYLAGRYTEALEEWRKVLEKGTGRREMAHLNIGEIYAKQGRYEEALAEMLEVRPRIRYPRELARIGYVYAVAGKRDEAVKILEEMKGLTGERYNLGTHIAAIYAALGKKDQAFAWLEKACDGHEHGVVDLKVDPRFDTLRSHPRFTTLLRRVKLAP